MGSGRTEIARAILGAERAEGECEFEGKAMGRRSPRMCRRMGICMVPEDRKRDGSMSGRPIAESINAGILGRLTGARDGDLARVAAAESEYLGGASELH
ncbi:MAG: hypothetical protein NTU53_23180 [Planctomycetota bacterium]|nr:hypothetical protein [Planctomycetota bacterium]